MRMGAILLGGPGILSLMAQDKHPLPWERSASLSWQARTDAEIAGASLSAESPTEGSLRVRLTPDGTLSVVDRQGVRRMKLGLPGRVLQMWRDAGLPLPLTGEWTFPEKTPLSQGLSILAWGTGDFRPNLKGLMWILEDGESFLTVVHPATARAIHLPLPSGQNFQLLIEADRLELASFLQNGTGMERRWSLSWLALLPQFLQLGPPPNPSQPGGALVPFPN